MNITGIKNTTNITNYFTYAFKLYGCWLVGRDPVNLDAADPTNPWKWNLEFRYAAIEDMSILQQTSLVK